MTGEKLMKTLIKLGFSVLATAVALIPLWFFLLVKTLLSPEGFWQKFVVYGTGTYLLCFIQLILCSIWILVLIAIWEDLKRLKRYLKYGY